MSELVTGEAVALELQPARLPSRALATLLDLTVAVVVYVGVSVALVLGTASLDDAAQVAVSIAAFLLVLVGGPIAVETLSHGRSLGKAACGLRVVRDDGGPIRFRHALVRGAIGVVEILLTGGVVACIASLVSARGRRVGDVFAGTLVVRERVPVARTGFVAPPPPWLAGRFSGLDLSAVPEGLWLAIRQYLGRMHQLDPQVGWTMAQRLAGTWWPTPGRPRRRACHRPRTWRRWCRSGRRGRSGGPLRRPPLRRAPCTLPFLLRRPRTVRCRALRRPPRHSLPRLLGVPWLLPPALRATDPPSSRPAGVRARGSSRPPDAAWPRSVAPGSGPGHANVDGGDSRSSSSMPGAERTTSPAMCTECCSPVSRVVTW